MNKGVETIIPSIARKKLDKSERRLKNAVEVVNDCLIEHEAAVAEYKRVCAFQYSKGLDELG
jgi:hypothetical protein